MHFFIQRSELRDLYDKVVAGERISEADALRLFESKDLNAVGAIADFARQKKTGNNRASYIINRYVNYSNFCIQSCQFCSVARKKRDADGFELTIPQIVEKAREALKLGITELHFVGGLHPSLPLGYYTGMLKALRALYSDGRAALPRSQDDQQVVLMAGFVGIRISIINEHRAPHRAAHPCARTCRLMPDSRCKWPMIESRFLAVGFPFGPSIRIKLFDSVPVTSASRPNPTVALM